MPEIFGFHVMLRESKVDLLAAHDALSRIEFGRQPEPLPGIHKGGPSARCDVCGRSLASGTPHETTTFQDPVTLTQALCPVGVALAALRPYIPTFENRVAFLDPPPTTFAGA